MHIDILSPEKRLFEGEAVSIQLPGMDGRFQVLENHAPIISSLMEGTITIRSSDGDHQFEIRGGFVEVIDNKVSVLVESLLEV